LPVEKTGSVFSCQSMAYVIQLANLSLKTQMNYYHIKHAQKLDFCACLLSENIVKRYKLNLFTGKDGS